MAHKTELNILVISQPASTWSKLETEARSEICSQLTIKTPERRQC